MPQRRPHCAHPRSPSFKLTPFALAFIGLFSTLAIPSTAPLAADDPYANITPFNYSASTGYWETYQMPHEFTATEPDVYFGGRADRATSIDVMKFGGPGEYRVEGTRIHVFSRPRRNTEFNNGALFGLLSLEQVEHRTMSVNFNAELIVDAESALTHSNWYPLVQGIATDNNSADYYPQHTAHTKVDFLKPVRIRVNNNSTQSGSGQPDMVVALGVKDWKNKASHVTFHDTVTANSTSAFARPVSGIIMDSKYADTGDGMPTLHFRKDATFTAQNTGGGDALGAKFFATGWTDDELNTSNSALDHFTEDDIAVLRNTVHQQKLITDAGSTFTLTARVEASESPTSGSAIGMSTFGYQRSEQIFELAGKTVVSASSNVRMSTMGLNHRVNESTFNAHFDGGLEVESHASSGSSWGVYTAVAGGVYRVDATETSIEASATGATRAMHLVTSKPGHAEDTPTAVHVNEKYRGTTTFKATSSNNWARAIEFTLKNVTSSIEFDQLRLTSSGHPSKAESTQGIKINASSKAKSDITIHNLELTSSGHGVYQDSGADSQANMTIHNAVINELSGYAFIATTASGATDTSHIRLKGSLSIAQSPYLMYATGKGAWIETDLIQTGLSGDVDIEDGARLTLGLSAPEATANLHLTNALTPENPATIEVNLKNGGRWTAIGEPSHINSLTFASRGALDLSQVEPETEPEEATDSTSGNTERSARMLRAAALTSEPTATDRTATEPTAPAVTPTPASLVTNELMGTDGWITLTVNTQTNEGQVLEIVERSEGEHTLDIQNQSDQQPTGMPILLVRSVNGLTNPNAYTATFKEAQLVEVGELKYYVGNSTMVNDEASTSSHPERAVDDENTDNWYLYTAYRPEPTPELEPTPEPTPEPTLPAFTDTAKGAIGASTANYLLALQTAETLRERLGDIHTFASRDERVTPWAKVSGTNWRIAPQITASAWDLDLRHVKVGADTPVGDVSRVGGYFGYTDFSSQRPAPADIKGRAMEGGLYWTALFNNRVFTDLVARVGRVESQFDTVDTRGAAVKARDLHNHYFGLSLNVGRQLPVTEHLVFEPMAYVGYTRFADFESRSDHGLHAKTKGFNSLLTMLGTTAEWRMVSDKGNAWTLYAKAFWEKEWLAKNAITFNDFNTYDVKLKASRFVYGLGAEGPLGKATTWHVDVERSTGNVLREDWQVNAGLRIPF
ncbi:MAG: autotransporter outer membrane beta-barrel domain-containing protein [Sutterella sp.]|nr:autotransporter outer membrane beta-barrel domain-containing protein [Sutterella sp.]